MKTWPPSEGLKWDLIKKDYVGVEIPEPAHTYGYMHGVFGYMNDQQLAIGESTIGNVRKLGNPTPTAKTDITMLTLLAMERCKTAREAIQLMGSLAEKYGYGFVDGGEMLAVTDPKEVWIFEIMPVGPLWTPESGKPGAVWCAQRVPDDDGQRLPQRSRASARSTWRTRTTSWPRPTSSPSPSSRSSTTRPPASPSTGSGPTPPAPAAP